MARSAARSVGRSGAGHLTLLVLVAGCGDAPNPSPAPGSEARPGAAGAPAPSHGNGRGAKGPSGQAALPEPGAQPGRSGPGGAAEAGSTDTAGGQPQATPDDPLAGTWWALLPDQPWISMRVGLEPVAGDAARMGRWITFDWGGSNEEGDLRRRSKPVAITAVREGDGLRLEGPSPMLTEKGDPNGQRGTWRLELKAASLPGEAMRFTGRAYHTELTPPEGTPVEFVRSYRTWGN